ncbi:MAG TPA: hypothetical protein VFD35_00925 [Pricia sp.]|nr:hypothetical protein [Pricia sp.]
MKQNDKDTRTKSDQAKKVEEFYYECQNWKSKLWFMQDETIFLDGLLNSYVFEPDTPNLFVRLQDYLERLQKADRKKRKIMQRIIEHEKKLVGIFDCKDYACDLSFYQKHDVLKAEVVSCVEDFQNLKGEIFNYAGGILKKRKPKE